MSEKVRLLVCHTDGSVQELPWCGKDPQCAHPGCVEPLEYRLAEHIGHRVSLADIEESQWKNPEVRSAALEGFASIVSGPGKGTGLGAQFYDVRSTFKEDAMECWRRHNRTKNCQDYKSDRMRLYPDTKAERKEEGLDPKMRPTTSLCEFCPVNMIVLQRMRSDKYSYNYDV